MLDADLGYFDHVVAMDSLIHYEPPHVVRALSALSERTVDSMLMTFAPRTPLLATMRIVGRAFPRADRAPSIVPVSETALLKAIASSPVLEGWQAGRMQRVSTGFYISQALEVRRAP
jgi:magnesium-protoporphyrin O-methyltransferase